MRELLGGKCPTREWRSRFTIRGAGDQAQPYERATSTVCLTQIVGALVTIRSHVANRLWSEFKVKSGRRGWFCVILPFGETPTPPRRGPPHPHHITPLCDSVALASMGRFQWVGDFVCGTVLLRVASRSAQTTNHA